MHNIKQYLLTFKLYVTTFYRKSVFDSTMTRSEWNSSFEIEYTSLVSKRDGYILTPFEMTDLSPYIVYNGEVSDVPFDFYEECVDRILLDIESYGVENVIARQIYELVDVRPYSGLQYFRYTPIYVECIPEYTTVITLCYEDWQPRVLDKLIQERLIVERPLYLNGFGFFRVNNTKLKPYISPVSKEYYVDTLSNGLLSDFIETY